MTPLTPEKVGEIRLRLSDTTPEMSGAYCMDLLAMADDLLAHIDRLSDAVTYARENLIANGMTQAAILVAGHVEGLTTPRQDWKHRPYSGSRQYGVVSIGLN